MLTQKMSEEVKERLDILDLYDVRSPGIRKADYLSYLNEKTAVNIQN